MTQRIRGQVRYANGFCAAGIEVSIWDLDPGRSDDDLLSDGSVLTGADGVFEIEFDPSRYQDLVQTTYTEPRRAPLDWALQTYTIIEPDQDDQYLPVVRFRYPFNGQHRTHNVQLDRWKGEAVLPLDLQTPFLPSQHGWQFSNLFPGYALPFGLPFVPGLLGMDSVYGLCGGMVATALDFFLCNRSLPAVKEPPAAGTDLQRYLFHRQMESFGTLGAVIRKFHQWMGLPDDTLRGTWRQTWNEFERKIRPALGHHRPVPLGIQYIKWQDSNNLSLNHQVLAYSCRKLSADTWRIGIYDPNFPRRDDVSLFVSRIPVAPDEYGLSAVQQIGRQSRSIYGFFSIPYRHVFPPTQPFKS